MRTEKSTEENNGFDLTPHMAIIEQLPVELQLLIIEPDPQHLQMLDDVLESPAELRKNMIELVIEHQRIAKLNWDDDHFQDFYCLMEFLELHEKSQC